VVIILFGSKLKELREKHNITQEEFGKILKVTKGTISNWEMNRTQPPFDTLKQIADYFGVSIDYLLDVDYNKLDKLKTSLKENGMMQGDDLSQEELEKILRMMKLLIRAIEDEK
jgi:transcriptional regulator with XRE-family HTH domain